MFQTWDNSQLCIDSQYSSQMLTIVWSLKHQNTQPIYIFNWVRVLHLDSLKEGTWLHSFVAACVKELHYFTVGVPISNHVARKKKSHFPLFCYCLWNTFSGHWFWNRYTLTALCSTGSWVKNHIIDSPCCIIQQRSQIIITQYWCREWNVNLIERKLVGPMTLVFTSFSYRLDY